MVVAVDRDTGIDKTDKALLNLLQDSFPLVSEPFAGIAESLAVSENEVLERTQRLKDDRIIRELGPIFDTRALGYKSMLVAAKVDHDRRRQAAEVINSHPGVSHNYLRDNDFNLWFTIAVAPDSKLGLERTLEILQEEAGLESYRSLPTLKLFKIHVSLEMEEGSSALKEQMPVKPRPTEPVPLSEEDKLAVLCMQGDLPSVSRPYDAIAERLGWDCQKLIDWSNSMIDSGVLRRVAAILYHRRAGYSVNGMGVWAVPDRRVDQIGEQMASFRGVSHCYRRPTYPNWPYSVFTMVHGRSKQECEEVIATISEKTGIADYSILYSVAEYKKVRIKYFTPEFEQWEAKRL